MEAVAFVLASGAALLNTYKLLEAAVQRREAGGELQKLIDESKGRITRMRTSVARYRGGVAENLISGNVLSNAGVQFEEIAKGLKPLLEKRHIIWKHTYTGKVRECNDNLRELEYHLETCGLVTYQTKSLREQMKKLLDDSRRLFQPIGDSDVCRVISTITTALSTTDGNDDVDVIPEQAKRLLHALLESGLAGEQKEVLVDMARKVWQGWRVNPDDIEFVRKRNGERRRIGSGASGQVYAANMKLRDAYGDVITGEFKEVAVKEFAVPRSQEKEKLTQFIREVFLMMDAKRGGRVGG